jgi:hypothetical protein
MNGYLMPEGGGEAVKALYRSYQCGLCHLLESDYGFVYRMFATPDMVFLNVFWDALQGEAAPLGSKRCPVGLKMLPVRQSTSATRLAAAAGVFFAVEKLRDNWEDEKSWLAWLGMKFFERGHAKAEQILKEGGLELDSLKGFFKAQTALEKLPEHDLKEGEGPTVGIAGLTFGLAGSQLQRATGAHIGQELGRFLYYMDAALDLSQNQKNGQYNPLLKAKADREVGLAGARRAQAELALLLQGVGGPVFAPYLKAVVETGFKSKIAALARLGDSARSLRDLTPKPPYARLAVNALQLSVAMFILGVFPKNAWATALTAKLLSQQKTSWDRCIDVCFCSNICADGCDSVCNDCGSSCGDSCGDSVDSCDDACIW